MPRPTTLKEIDQAGHDLRLWCYACQRAGHIDAIIWERFAARGLPLAIDAARPYFPCQQCGARDCLILPATRPPSLGNPLPNLIAGYFHTLRSSAKNHRRR